MTKEEVAKVISLKLGVESFDNILKDIKEVLKANNITIIYGASDDLVEFEGAIYDECSEGDTILFDSNGVHKNTCDCGEECPNYITPSHVKYVIGSFADVINTTHLWSFETDAPFTGILYKDSEGYECEALVIDLKDI